MEETKKDVKSKADKHYNNSNNDNYGCSDIPNGFQGPPPELVAIIGEILGNIIAGNIPFNIQNIIGNWFELVGQVILVLLKPNPSRLKGLEGFFCKNKTAAMIRFWTSQL